MKTLRSFGVLVALSFLLGGMLPADATAQFAGQQKWLGGHVGLSGVGSAPSLGVSGEVAYNDRIAIGGWLDTWSYGESYGSVVGTTEWDVRYVAVAGTGSYHFPLENSPKWDPFVGLALGYYVVNSSTTAAGSGVTFSGDSSRLFFGGFGGVRYFFKESVSAVARAGFGASTLTLGLDFGL